ncbi:hypothetical protein BH10PSE17_BH10PSE17_23580 [soil metagenome]
MKRVMARRGLLLVLLASPAVAFAQRVEQIDRPRYDEAVAVAKAWLDAVDAGDAERAYAQLAPQFQLAVPAARFTAEMDKTRLKLGKRLSRNLRRVVWQDIPEGSSMSGLYAVIEVDSVYEHADKHFQFVVLYSPDAGPFKVLRNQATFTSK